MQQEKRAYGKLTLSLRMKDRREDGYNNLEALTVFLADVYDTIQLSWPRESRDILRVTGGDSDEMHSLTLDSNLVTQAITLFHDEMRVKNPGGTHYDFSSTLAKKIPLQAGLGGGSADAAATLHILNEIYGTVFTDEVLYSLAARLGSDVSACVHSRTCWMTGRGENIEPIDLVEWDSLGVLVVTPHILCSTPEVFKRYDQLGRPHDDGRQAPEPIRKYIETIHNDLALAAYDLYPELIDVKQNLQHQLGLPLFLAGSGSTLFACEKIDTLVEVKDVLDESLYRLCEISTIR